MNQAAIKDLLFKMADDALIIGHRNSEWTGIGPMLEEDLAFSSMAQDKIGHAQALYTILHETLGEKTPDELAFQRSEKEFKCCHLVEQPIGEYDFSLVRHFLFDHAELLRYEALGQSSFAPLAALARKVKGEVKYHVMHADTWIRQLANGTEESRARLQSSLNACWHLALGIFEPGEYEESLSTSGVFMGEKKLREQWFEKVTALIEQAGLRVPDTDESKIASGGRKGYHSVHLQPLLNEMCEVINSDPKAEW